MMGRVDSKPCWLATWTLPCLGSGRAETFYEKNDTHGMVQFFAHSGQANKLIFWVVAQAVNEILSDGDQEKQLMQGLLIQKEKIEQAGHQRRLC
jgi:hypothetical protein